MIDDEADNASVDTGKSSTMTMENRMLNISQRQSIA
jgi:hypothetical protein